MPATTTTLCGKRCAATSGNARIGVTCFRARRPATGRRSTICARHRPRRCLHRLAALQRRVVRSATHALVERPPTGRCRNGGRDRRAVVRTHADGRRYINYRDLGVQQLGSIYERLLEQEIVRNGDRLLVRLNVFARKNTGSYYTPDDLVGLIIKETIDPLIQSRMDRLHCRSIELASSPLPEDRRIGRLKRLDPATRFLELKVCDPPWGRVTSWSTWWIIFLIASSRPWPTRKRPGRVPVAVDRAHRQHSQHDHHQCGGSRLDRRCGATRRSAHRASHGAQALRLRSGQEPDGG